MCDGAALLERSGPTGLRRGKSGFQYVCEGEGDCTSERARGQFSIFGATDENTAADLGRGFLKGQAEKRNSKVLGKAYED
jgi:hypothetical protein